MRWSLGVMVTLIAFSLAEVVLPEIAPNYHTGWYWWAALVGALAFVASLLAHELSHALVARRCGMAVDSITLWLFGGVAQLRGAAHRPSDLLRVTLAGPAMSLLVAVSCLTVGVALEVLGGPMMIVAVLLWLAVTSTMLAFFNLLPAAPLDGGRVLTALLWLRNGDRLASERTASRVGAVLGQLLTVVGLVLFVGQQDLSGLWLAFLGWYLAGAARQEERLAEAQQLTAGRHVRDVMTPNPITVPVSWTVEQLVDQMVSGPRIGTYPVVDHAGTVVGLVTEDRVRRVPRSRWVDTTLADIALPLEEVAGAAPEDLLSDALERVGPDGRILVFSKGRLVGLVSPSDLASLVSRLALRGDASAAAIAAVEHHDPFQCRPELVQRDRAVAEVGEHGKLTPANPDQNPTRARAIQRDGREVPRSCGAGG
ncbi:MAG: site-2 protease family protein [Acidimicrobiales bacterium]